METLSLPSIAFYCLFSVFIFYQQLHVKNFRGASEGFRFLLTISSFLGLLTGFAYLGYYGWSVVWWAPFIIFILGILAAILGGLLERVGGALALSLAGFVGWPISASLMFQYVPN
ncbi:hypothetical protein [Guyparkeria halopsychrophila]|uniref:hypothetical protein n=1 Tax=Guyparkeria halopsychrophila TaxID=3139421 RepID=UPI0037CB84B3